MWLFLPWLRSRCFSSLQERDEMRVLLLVGSALLMVSMVHCARFNTFYNAQRYFQQAEESRSRSGAAQPSSSEIELYDKAIKKASKVLTFYPKSKLVDDALLLMGKAFYRKGEYLKAVRKFSELITNFPQSDLVYEASFWLGTCHYAGGDYEKAERSLASIVTQKGAKRWAAEAQFLLAEMAFGKQRYGYAIEEYAKVVERFPKSFRCAEAQYRIGQCLSLLGRHSEARQAYDCVFKFSPHDTLKLNTTFSIGQSLREEGRYDEATDIFENLLEDSRNMDYYPAIRLEMAECEAEKGALETAISEYEKIIEDYPKSESSAEAHHRLGLIYLNVLGDLAKAKEHLDAVRAEYAKSKFAEEAQRIGTNIDGLSKLYQQLSPPPPDSSASESESQPTEQEQEWPSDDEALDELVNSILAGADSSAPSQPSPLSSPDSTAASGEDSLPVVSNKDRATAVDTAEIHFKLAELYLLQFSKADSALKHYQVVMDRFPESDYGAKSAFAMAWITDMILNDARSAQEAYLRIIETFPDTPYERVAREALGKSSADEQDTSLARAQFEEAENLFLRGGDADSLIAAYQKIIDEYPDTPYAPKAGYAIAWIWEYVKADPKGAEEAYQKILEAHGDTDYGMEAKIKLGMAQRVKRARAAPQPEEKREPQEQRDREEMSLEDIIQEMLEEGPIIYTEPESGQDRW